MIESPNISELDSDDIQAKLEFLSSYLSSEYPDLDLTPGRVLYDILLRPAAIYHVLADTYAKKIDDSYSLSKLAEDPTLADATILEGLAANFGIARKSGTTSTGQLIITVNSQTVIPIIQGTTFTTNNTTFEANDSFTAVLSEDDVVVSTDRVLVDLGNGNYSFTIDVDSSESGETIAVKKNTVFSMTNPLPNLVTVIAASDFTGGAAEESDAALVSRIQNGVAAKVLCTRANIEALLRAEYTDITDISIIGYGDDEMLRDRHNIFSISYGGKADIYVRTQKEFDRVSLTKEATLVDTDNGYWQFTLDTEESAGVLLVESVNLVDDTSLGSLTLVSTTYAIDTTADGPLITDTEEGVYSSFYTTTIKFEDTASTVGKSLGDKQNYTIVVKRLPNIAEIQEFVSDRDNRHIQSDILVKSPIPCFVSVNMNIKAKDITAVDTDKVVTAIVNAINTSKFEDGGIEAGTLISAAQTVIPTSATVNLPIGLTASIYKPDASIKHAVGTNEITLPDEPENLLTNRTIALFSEPSLVEVTVSSSDAREV